MLNDLGALLLLKTPPSLTVSVSVSSSSASSPRVGSPAVISPNDTRPFATGSCWTGEIIIGSPSGSCSSCWAWTPPTFAAGLACSSFSNSRIVVSSGSGAKLTRLFFMLIRRLDMVVTAVAVVVASTRFFCGCCPKPPVLCLLFMVFAFSASSSCGRCGGSSLARRQLSLLFIGRSKGRSKGSCQAPGGRCPAVSLRRCMAFA